MSSSNGIEQTIQLLDTDVTAIKKIAGLMRTKQSSYMIISHLAVTDLAGNHLIPYVDGLALACQTYIPDTDPPHLLSTELVGLKVFCFFFVLILFSVGLERGNTATFTHRASQLNSGVFSWAYVSSQDILSKDKLFAFILKFVCES